MKDISNRACFKCNQRKIKCNRQSPCSNCVRTDSECTYPITHGLKKRLREGANEDVRNQDKKETIAKIIEDLNIGNEIDNNISKKSTYNSVPHLQRIRKDYRYLWTFIDKYSWQFPFIHPPSFLASLNDKPSYLLLSVYLFVSSSTLTTSQKNNEDNNLYEYTRQEILNETEESLSILELVHSLLILSEVASIRSIRADSHLFLKTAIQLSLNMKLNYDFENLLSYSSKIVDLNEIESEIRRRTWWYCYTLERVICSTTIIIGHGNDNKKILSCNSCCEYLSLPLSSLQFQNLSFTNSLFKK